MQMGGHSAVSMVATYHKPNQTAYDFAIRSKHGDADSIRKQIELLKAGGNSTTGAIVLPPVSVVPVDERSADSDSNEIGLFDSPDGNFSCGGDFAFFELSH